MMAAKRLRVFVVLALVALVCMGAALVHPVAAWAAGAPPEQVEVGGTDVTAGDYWANDGSGGLVPVNASNYNVHLATVRAARRARASRTKRRGARRVPHPGGVFGMAVGTTRRIGGALCVLA